MRIFNPPQSPFDKGGINFKNLFLTLTTSFLILISVIGLFSCQSHPGNLIRIGYQPYWVGEANIIQAMKRMGLLEKMGYRVEYYRFLSGPGVNEALAAGSIDAGVGGDLPTVLALASGMKITVLASVGKSLRQAIVVGKGREKEIRRVADLVGKKVAVAKGSTSHFFLYRTLAENGIDPARVSIIHLSVKVQPQALASGEVDAAATWEPWPSRLEKEGIGRILWAGDFPGFLYARKDFLSRNPRGAADLVKALQQALEYAARNREQTCRWVSEDTGDDYLMICRAMETDRIFAPGGTIRPEPELMAELKQVAEFSRGQKLIERIPEIESNFDLTYVEQALNDQGRKLK